MSDRPADESSANLQPTDNLLEIFRRTGAPEDFERVVRRYAALVYGECWRVAGNSHDAEDAAQLAFLALAIELRSGGGIKRPAGWLQRVAKRHAMKIVRSRGRRKKREDAARRPEVVHHDATAVRDDLAQRDATANLVREAIDALPERHRLPLVLHYFGGLTLDAIATEMGLTRTAVGTRLHRARKLLGARLDERGVRFNPGELGSLIAVIVPAAVVATLVRSSKGITVGGTVGTAPFSLAAGVTQMLTVANTRSLVAAAAAVLCLSASGAAWVGSAAWSRLPTRADLSRWLEHLIDSQMPFEFRTDAAVINFGQANPDIANDPLSRLASEPMQSQRVTWPLFAFSGSREHAGASTLLVEDRQLHGEITPSDAPLRPVVESVGLTTSHWPPVLEEDRLQLSFDAPHSVSRTLHATNDNLEVGARQSETLTFDINSKGRFDMLALGIAPDERGAIFQNGGQTSVNTLVVGDAGTGDYELAGGRLDVGQVIIAARPRSSGSLHVGGGELHVTDPSVPITVGAQGSGRLLLGTQDAPGLLTTASGTDIPLIVRATASAQGLLQGWGDVASSGPLVNNGRVIADGFEHLRALNLSQLSSVTNTIDNAPDGTNGWYARRGGRVELPAMPLLPGTHQYTWGESADDPTIDLVNSVRLVAHNQPTTGSLSLALRTIALADPLDVPPPTGVAVFGLWEVAGVNFAPTSLDVDIRYDHVAADSLLPGEFATKLIGYEDGEWKLAKDQSIDFLDHIISGTFDGPVGYLAVGQFWLNPIGEATDNGMASAMSFDTTPSRVVTPEPTLLTPLFLFALARKRLRE